MKTVLFTGGGGAGSEALARLLAPRYEVHFADADPDSRPHGVAPDRWHAIPMATAPDFVPQLADLCRSLDVDVLIPGVDEELLPIALGATGCRVLLPPHRFVAAHLDKLVSSLRLQALGIPVPATDSLANHDRLTSFPCIVKPRHGRGSRSVGIARSQADALAHARAAGMRPDEFIAQEFLEGQEYSVTVVADSTGRLCAVVPVRCEYKRGISIRAVTDNAPEVIFACVKIHAADPVPGCYNVQVIKTTDGVKPFEVNPRVSSTLCLAIAAGIDPIDIFLRGGETLLFRDGVRLSRSWHNEITGAA